MSGLPFTVPLVAEVHTTYILEMETEECICWLRTVILKARNMVSSKYLHPKVLYIAAVPHLALKYAICSADCSPLSTDGHACIHLWNKALKLVIIVCASLNCRGNNLTELWILSGTDSNASLHRLKGYSNLASPNSPS